MPLQKTITIATTNIYFGGIPIRKDWLLVLDWVIAHFSIVKFKSENAARFWQSKNPKNPIEDLVAAHAPDILIVNEAMPRMRSDVIDLLKKKYQTVFVGYSNRYQGRLAVACVVAAQFPGTHIPMQLPDNASGGGACGMYIPSLTTTVLGAHPAALDTKARWQQLRYVATLAEKEVQRGRHVVIAGDLNSEIDEIRQADIRYTTLPIVNGSVPSFPTKRLMRQLRYPWWLLLKAYVGAWQARRAIDHIFIPKSWKMKFIKSMETSSDHEAVVVRAVTAS